MKFYSFKSVIQDIVGNKLINREGFRLAHEKMGSERNVCRNQPSVINLDFETRYVTTHTSNVIFYFSHFYLSNEDRISQNDFDGNKRHLPYEDNRGLHSSHINYS